MFVFFKNKKGQATVEFILVIAVLVPIVVATITYLNKNLFGKLDTWLSTEVVSQVRYGYARSELSNFDPNNATSINGPAPLMYGPDNNNNSDHPYTKIKPGWK